MDAPSPAAASAPRVTVVTATYNLFKGKRDGHFRECVESVHAQDYGNIEHLVVDGASTDGTLGLAREYEAKGWLRVFSEADTGIYDAFNKGLRMAGGKYIAFLNSDDWWHDARGVSRSVEMLERSGADFSYAPHLKHLRDGRAIPEQLPLGYFFIGLPFCHQTMFCRTDSLRSIGGFDASLRINADHLATMRIILRGGRGVHVPLNFTSFRATGISCDPEYDHLIARDYSQINRQLYQGIIAEEQMEGIRKGLLPDALKRYFKQTVHPSLYSSLAERCFWDGGAGVWRYYGNF